MVGFLELRLILISLVIFSRAVSVLWLGAETGLKFVKNAICTKEVTQLKEDNFL